MTLQHHVLSSGIAAASLLCISAVLAQPAPNHGDMPLQASSPMQVQLAQEGGGCWEGYTWHSVAGGCRILRHHNTLQSEACPSGWTGMRYRWSTQEGWERQAAPFDVYYPHPPSTGPWDESGCQPVNVCLFDANNYYRRTNQWSAYNPPQVTLDVVMHGRRRYYSSGQVVVDPLWSLQDPPNYVYNEYLAPIIVSDHPESITRGALRQSSQGTGWNDAEVLSYEVCGH